CDWSERTPLQASSIPTTPLSSWIRFPRRRAEKPAQFRHSTLLAATNFINPWVKAVSGPEGHGTPTKKNATGKLKCLNHGRPPASQMTNNVTATAIIARSQLTRRQSGFASWISLRGRSQPASSSETPQSATRETFGGAGAGREFHRK